LKGHLTYETVAVKVLFPIFERPTMKILLINKFLYPKGGDAICTLSTGELLRAHGHEVLFWGMDHPENPEYPHKDLFVDNIDFQQGGGIKKQLTAAMNILYSFEAKRKLRKLLNRVRPDVVHLNNFAHQISPSILDVIKQDNIPTVMTMHDYKLVCPAYTMTLNGQPCYRCQNGRYTQCFWNRCTKGSRAKSLINTMEMVLHHKILHIYDKLDVLISPSRFLKDRCHEMGLNREIVHIPNFVPVEDYRPQYEWKEKAITYVGRLSVEKGVRTLVQAMKGLDVRLKIIGDGPLREELEGMVRHEKIDNVMFLGYRTGEDLKNEMRNSMACVLPSECYENNPRSVIEAFALGKPVLGARIGGIPELVQDGKTGWTFESGNTVDLRAKIEMLINTCGEKLMEMGNAGRKEVESHFNPDKHYESLMAVYARILKEVRK
jgi:glycosyltransferase involved in cell wall biosynthesis